MDKLLEKLVQIVPDERQMKWHEMEFYAFMHFGINTFFSHEWGKGDEEPSAFNPSDLSTDSWAEAAVSAGMKGIILTAKHHDGFCLWDTKYTEHCVRNSPYKKDILAQLSESCKKYNIKLGVYLSPWDRHEPRYGTDEYNDYYVNQLSEICTNYGELFCLWFDGACGEGKNGKKQVYDWPRYYETIRKLQPNAAISICGPDVRWCGNEAGQTREAEWNVVPAYLQDCEKTAAKSQQTNDDFAKKKMSSTDRDLGSRALMSNYDNYIWYPCEVDVSIRPGWFYHKKQDKKVKSLKKLMEIYTSSVGGNASLLLNVPPDTRGRIADIDVKRLKEMGDAIRALYAVKANADCPLIYGRKEGEELVFDVKDTVKRLVLREDLTKSQRIERFEIENEKGKIIYKGTVVGSRRICEFKKPVPPQKLTLRVTSSRLEYYLKSADFYC